MAFLRFRLERFIVSSVCRFERFGVWNLSVSAFDRWRFLSVCVLSTVERVRFVSVWCGSVSAFTVAGV